MKRRYEEAPCVSHLQLRKSNLALETQALGAHNDSSFMAARFPPSEVNAGSEYLRSSGREFAFEEIPFRICTAKGNRG